MAPTGLTRGLARTLLLSLPTAHAATLLASHFEGNLYTLTLTDDSELTVGSPVEVGGMPSWLNLDSAGSTLYVTDESWLGGTTLSAWSVGEGGELTASGVVATDNGEIHSCLFGGENGEGFIAAPQFNAGGLITYSLPLDSSSTPLDTFQWTMSSPGPVPDRQDGPHPHSALTDPTGSFLLLPDLGADLIRILSISDSGSLTECPPAEAPPATGPRHGVFWSPEGDSETSILYTVNELGNSVTAWSVTYGDCLTLEPQQTIPTYPEDATAPDGSKAAAIIVRDGNLYATNRFDKSFGDTDSIAHFEIDGESGELSFVELVDSGTSFPRTFDLNAEGDMLAVGGQSSADVAIIERNVTTGRLGGILAQARVGIMGQEGQEDGLSDVIWSE